MSKALKYIIAYGMWIVDLGLSAWLFSVSRTTLLTFLAQFYELGDFRYSKTAGLVDNAFTLVLGISWLALLIFTEEYYRTSALEEGLTKRFARVTGPILLCYFVVDLILFWLQGIRGDDWLRWLMLSAELVVGLLLVMYGRKNAKNKPK
jgi:hypothetical protein